MISAEYEEKDFVVEGICQSCQRSTKVKYLFDLTYKEPKQKLMCFRCYGKKMRKVMGTRENGVVMLYGCPFV